MYLKSLYPDLPDIPPQNLHHILFHRQDQREWTDYALLIDAATGGQMSYHEFYERVMDGATALGSPISKQGLGLNGGIVGILSENCMVCSLSSIKSSCSNTIKLNGAGLYSYVAFFTGDHYTVCSSFVLLYPL